MVVPLEQGKIALQQYNCSSCDVIPDVTTAANHVGPPLTNLASQSFIAGILENTDSNLAARIRFPQRIDPGSAMPDLGVSALHADQMVEYLKSISNKH